MELSGNHISGTCMTCGYIFRWSRHRVCLQKRYRWWENELPLKVSGRRAPVLVAREHCAMGRASIPRGMGKRVTSSLDASKKTC